MHTMVKHVPDQMRRLNGIKRFSGQGKTFNLVTTIIDSAWHTPVGTEKNNDDARRNYMSSNHLDAPRDILLTEDRLRQLARFERQKRDYNKTDTDYWEEEIYTKRRKDDDNNDDDDDN